MDPYSKRATPGLWRNARRVASALSAGSIAIGLSGCSANYQLGEMFGRSAAPAVTQSASAYAPVDASKRPALEQPTEADLAIAKAAAAELLARGGKDAGQWENARTGARGTITPIAANYTQAGATCRDFLASHVRGSHEAWYQGSACRAGTRWHVRELRPLQRS